MLEDRQFKNWQAKNLRYAKNNKNFKFIKLDLTKQNKLKKIFNNKLILFFTWLQMLMFEMVI